MAVAAPGAIDLSIQTDWLVGLASAFGLKLSSSIDDVVWLAPFLTAASRQSIRFQNSCIYTAVCLTQTLVAMLIAYSGREAVRALTGGAKDAWSTEKILTVGAGCLLSLYSVKLSYEYYLECYEEPEEGGAAENPENGGGTYAKVPGDESAAFQEETRIAAPYESGRGGGWCCTSPPPDANLVPPDSGKRVLSARQVVELENPTKAEEERDKADKARQTTLFVIAFIGSVDDLTLFVPMLVGKSFDIVQLMLGAFLATSVIITFCICIGLCKPISDCLAKIPLAAIVICFATVLLLKGFVFDEEK